MPVPRWLRKRDHVLWDTADVIVKKIGEEAFAIKTDTRQVIARGIDYGKVLISSIKTLEKTGGKIFIDWIYERDGFFYLAYPAGGIPNKYEEIDLKEDVVIEGITSHSVSDKKGTTLYVRGTGSDIGLHLKSATGGWTSGRLIFRNLNIGFSYVSRGILFDHVQVDFENVGIHVFNPLVYSDIEPYMIYISGVGPPGARSYWNALSICVGYADLTTPVPILWTHRADWVYIDELFVWIQGNGVEVIRVDNQLMIDKALIMLWNDEVKNNILFNLRGNHRTLSINDMLIAANDWDNPYRNTNKIFQIQDPSKNRVELKRLFLPPVTSPGTQITITDSPEAVFIDKIIEWQDDYTFKEKPYTKSGGVAVFSGDGSTVQFRVEHGLVAKPSKIIVTPLSADAKDFSYAEADDTYIYFNFSSAPPSGTDNVKLSWYAEV